MEQTIVNNLLKRLVFFLFMILLFTSCSEEILEYKKIKGNVFGTTFLIKYSDNKDYNYNAKIKLLFDEMNNSMSTYHQNSLISSLNNGLLELKVDNYFLEVFEISKEVHRMTDGYFDPTIGKMINAWGFGKNKFNEKPTKYEIDSLLSYVGFDKVSIKNDTISKQNKNIIFDFNATAKGYGVDVVGDFLENNGVKNYLIEIGGEIKAVGVNKYNQPWSIGIEEPNFDGTRSLQKIVRLKNESIATSGNYRKYRIDSITGKKIAHTFNPKTGSPAITNLLSVSVIAPRSCAEVDAYATAFMAMGYKKAKKLALKQDDMKVYFIYLEENKLNTYASNNLEFY